MQYLNAEFVRFLDRKCIRSNKNINKNVCIVKSSHGDYEIFSTVRSDIIHL